EARVQWVSPGGGGRRHGGRRGRGADGAALRARGRGHGDIDRGVVRGRGRGVRAAAGQEDAGEEAHADGEAQGDEEEDVVPLEAAVREAAQLCALGAVEDRLRGEVDFALHAVPAKLAGELD